MKSGVFNPKIQSSVTQSKRSGRGGFYEDDETKQEVKTTIKINSTSSNIGSFKENQPQYTSTTKVSIPKFTM